MGKITDITKMILDLKNIAERAQEQAELHLDRATSGDERRKLAATDPKIKAYIRASQCASLTATHLGKTMED